MKLAGLKEMLDITFWDTVVAGEGPVRIDRRQDLFGSRNIGRVHLTNMMCAHTFPAHNTFTILSAPTLVSFEDERLYGVVARDAVLTLEVGQKRELVQRLPLTMVRGEKPAQRWASPEDFNAQYEHLVKTIRDYGISDEEHRTLLQVLYAQMPGALQIPIHVPDRQEFSVTFEFFNDAADIIGQAKGCKSIVQCLRGIYTRDVL
jgi:hypothetical protein